MQYKPIFRRPSDHAGAKQQHAGEGRKQQRRGGQQVQGVEDIVGLGATDHGMPVEQLNRTTDEQYAGGYHAHIAQHCRHL